MSRATERMGRTIEAFSDLARLEAGELRLELRTTFVAEVVRSASDRVRREATAEDVSLALEVDPEVTSRRIRCDPRRFEQIVAQLYACVARALPQRGCVLLRAGVGARGSVRFEVEARDEPGAGPLGEGVAGPELAIARGLVEPHGAKLGVEGKKAGAVRLSFSLETEADERDPRRPPQSHGRRSWDVGGPNESALPHR